MNNKWVRVVVFAVATMVLWNLLDYLYNTFITPGGFQFKVLSSAVLPLIVGAVVGYFSNFGEQGE